MKKVFWAFVVISILLHLYAITFPLATLEDESFHVERAIYTMEIINFIPFWGFLALILLSILFIYISYLIYKKNVNLFIIFMTLSSVIYYFLVNHLAVAFNILKFGKIDLYNLFWLIRYGSLGTLVYTLQLMLFGYKEWGMRIAPLIFSILSAVYLYKLVLMYKSERVALFSSISLLFMPGFFYFVNIGQLTTGVIFFFIISLYFLLKYTRENKKSSLVYMCIFLIAGFQYKETFIFIYGSIFLYLIYSFLIKKKLNFRAILKYLFLSLIPTLLWLVTQTIFNQNILQISRGFTLQSGLLSSTRLIDYFLLLPKEITLPLTILFLISLPFVIHSIIKEKDELSFIFLTSFLIIYTFFTLNKYIIVYRYGADLIPFATYFVFLLLDKIKIKKIYPILSSLLVIFLIITSAYLTYNNWENRFVPMDGTFSYIKDNVPADARILKTMAPNPYKFYIGKYDLKQEFKHEIWAKTSDKNITNLYNFMKQENYSYFIFPRPTISYSSYWPDNYTWVDTINTSDLSPKPVLNEALLYQLEVNNNYFEVLYNQSLGPNAFYLVKIK